MVSKTQMRGSVVPLGLVCLLIEAWVGLLCRAMSVTRTPSANRNYIIFSTSPGRLWLSSCLS